MAGKDLAPFPDIFPRFSLFFDKERDRVRKTWPWLKEYSDIRGLACKRKTMSVEIDPKKATRLLFELFNDNQKKGQIALDADLAAKIEAVLDGPQKTYRYILFTGILAKTTTPKCHARSLQLRWANPGAFDARSFCTKVVLPFEATCLPDALGGSPDPFVNNPARFESVELTNATQGAAGRLALENTHAVLESLQDRPASARPALAHAIAHLRAKMRPPKITAKRKSVVPTNETLSSFLDFLDANCGGEAATAITGCALRILFPKAKVVIHRVNQAGAPSTQYGDIDVVFSDKKVYAVEVKDKPFNDASVDRSAALAFNRGAKKLIWAVGMHGEASAINQQNKIAEWARQGLDLSFLKLADLLKALFAAFGEDEWQGMVDSTASILSEMKARSSTMAKFRKAFPENGI